MTKHAICKLAKPLIWLPRKVEIFDSVMQQINHISLKKYVI